MKVLKVNGAEIPALGFGTWRLRGMMCRDMVRFALDLGYRHIDTAAIYGNEEEVGHGIAESSVERSDIFLTTKVGPNNLKPDALKRSAEESIRRLGTGYVDLLLIHWPNIDVPLADSLDAMRGLQAEGTVRHIGVSNFPVVLLREAIEEIGAPIIANQVEYHPYLSQNHVLEYCRKAGIMLTAYCPVAEGRVNKDPDLLRIADKHDRSAAQITLRWLLDQDCVSAIPMTTSPEHCRDNLKIFDFELDAEDRAAIAAMATGTRLIDMHSGVDWDPD